MGSEKSRMGEGPDSPNNSDGGDNRKFKKAKHHFTSLNPSDQNLTSTNTLEKRLAQIEKKRGSIFGGPTSRFFNDASSSSETVKDSDKLVTSLPTTENAKQVVPKSWENSLVNEKFEQLELISSQE